jgi:hypothetical protein
MSDFTAVSIHAATMAKVKEFQALLAKHGLQALPKEIEPPVRLSISSVIDVALAIATQVIAGAAVAVDRRKRKR